MFKYVIIIVLLGVTTAAPTTESKVSPYVAAPETPISDTHVALTSEVKPHHAPVIVESVTATRGALADTNVNTSVDFGSNAAIALTPTAKQLFIAELPLAKTPASTAKLIPLATPLVTPLSPFTYAASNILAPYSTWSGFAAIPASYSIEQHGYHITY